MVRSKQALLTLAVRWSSSWAWSCILSLGVRVRDMSVVYLPSLSTLAEEVKSHSASVLPKTCIELACGPHLHTASLGLVLCEPQVDESHSCADDSGLAFLTYVHIWMHKGWLSQRESMTKGMEGGGSRLTSASKLGNSEVQDTYLPRLPLEPQSAGAISFSVIVH